MDDDAPIRSHRIEGQQAVDLCRAGALPFIVKTTDDLKPYRDAVDWATRNISNPWATLYNDSEYKRSPVYGEFPYYMNFCFSTKEDAALFVLFCGSWLEIITEQN